MKTIDMSTEIDAIKDKFNPKYHNKQEAINEAAVLWGCNPNEHGVLPMATETIVDVGQCKGEVKFSETSKGHWLIGISAMSSFNGWGYAPNVWNTTGYESYHDARLAGVLKLKDFFERVATEQSSTNSEANRVNAQKAVHILNAERTPQLGLF